MQSYTQCYGMHSGHNTFILKFSVDKRLVEAAMHVLIPWLREWFSNANLSMTYLLESQVMQVSQQLQQKHG